MDDVLQQEIGKTEKRLLKTLEQGDKINNLTTAPEWEFFEDFLKASKETMVKRLYSDKFINDHNGYLYTAAAVQTIEGVLLSIDQFKKKYVEAARKLNELEYGKQR